jgi:alpha-tubulin suppressor-like RCC1 family protein
MKLVPPDRRKAISAVRLALSLVVTALVPLLLYATPAWWSQRGVLVENATADDYAPVNQGQLKNIASAAVSEMDTKLPGGAGDALHSLINSWSTPASHTNDFAPVNLGQLKTVAKPFYDRLIAAGLVDYYPWLNSINPSYDFAVANVGQAKNLFAFEIPTSNSLTDPLQNRLAAGQFAGNLALEENAVWFWGNRFGGDSNFQRTYPHRMTGLSGMKSVSAGDDHMVTLDQNGTVLTWGKNTSGQLGDGTNVDHSTPTAVPNLSHVLSVKAGSAHTVILQQDGTVLAWGDNYYGQLGNGNNIASSAPVSVMGLNDVHKIAAGSSRTAALKNDGTVWTWGYDHYAPQIGRDISNNAPLQVSDLADVIDIAAGYEHVVAVKTDGTVWAWGSNYWNQLGNGNSRSVFQETPVQVVNLGNVRKVASSFDHTLAILDDGTVWAWGSNLFGQLGDGTTKPRQGPVQVRGLTDVVALATSYQYSLAMKADGTVWTWGDGSAGTLPGVDLHVPQQVGLGLFDANHNGMDDRWESEYFGGLGQSPDTDFDGDGISNLQEFLRGTDPRDYFNGATPIIEIAGGNNQIGDPGKFLSKPFKVRVRNQTGQLLVNAPVSFTVSGGSGSLAATLDSPQQESLLLRTDTNGEAAAYHALPDAAGTSTRTVATAGNSAAAIMFRGVVRFSLPTPVLSATPTPDPNASPTPTPTASPVGPYRYAVIDLGKDLYPIRINNQGQILVQGVDANDNWGYFRWKGGVLERLNYTGPNTEIIARDLNDSGTVVGAFLNEGPWVRDTVNELRGGLVWPANSANATKISAPSAYRRFEPQKPGSLRLAELSAVNNDGAMFGVACTGTVRGFLNQTLTVMNGERWPATSGVPTPLSQESAINNPPDSDVSNWQGASDTIRRANSQGEYIGRKFTPFATLPGFLQGIETGMVDGQSASFNPVDINEAGIVVGSAGADMVIVSSPTSQITINGASPLAINDHTRPAPSAVTQSSPAPSPSPTPVPIPQILAWSGNALVLLERQDDGHKWHPFGLEEMVPTMDGWENLNPYDMNDNGVIVGTGWHTDPSNPQAPGEYHAFLLVAVELMVDGNRDGEMSFTDPVVREADQTSEEKPYRFWVNDDQDAVSGTNISDEITPPQLRDNQDEKIQSVRDCEDLARLRMNIGGLTESFKTGALKFVLKFRNVTSGNPAVRVFRAVENGGRGYVTSEAWGALQASPPYDQALSGVNGPGIASLTSGIHVDRRFWEGIDESDPNINLLFEGVQEGKGELYFEIISDGRRVGASPGVWLDIKNVQKMYERVKALPENIVAPYTVPQAFSGPANYVSDPNGSPFEKSWDESEQCVVFVHGWNVSYDEYLGVAQTLFKRLWHQGFKGHLASFRWDTRKSDNMFDAGEYNRSENRAFVYAAALKQWAMSLSNTYTVNIVGHSMGNVVCGEALRQGLQVRNYILMEAAIPMSCYAPDADRLPRLEDQDRDHPTPDYHRNPTTNEVTLGYRGYISSVAANLVNFYNEQDWALATGRSEIVPGFPGVETNWEKNQIDYKPDGAIPGAVHAGTWSYHYDPSQPPVYSLLQRASVVSSASRNVSDSWEMKAFVARSRTKAVGAFLGGGSLGATENLRENFGFRNVRADHSGQFTRTIQSVEALYKRIRERIEE